MKKRLLSKLTVWLLIALTPIMGFAIGSMAAESALKVSVSDTDLLVADDGAFSFTVILDSAQAYRAADVGVFVSDGVEITEITVDNGATAIGPTEARGLEWFGYNVSKAYTGETKLTVSGICMGAGDWAVKVESAKITYPDYSTEQVTSGLTVHLSRISGTPATTSIPTTTTEAPATTTTPATTTAAPVTTPTRTTETQAPVMTTEPAATSAVSDPATQSSSMSTVAPTPTTEAPATSNGADNGETPEVPTTGDMNAPLLQISCAVIAVIAAGTLIYITLNPKMKKGE